MLRTGIDLIDVGRFERMEGSVRERFLRRVFTAAELALCAEQNQHLAGRFAAKEAVSKALGVGIGTVHWQEIEILRDELGAPQLRLSGEAFALAERIGLRCWSVSITHLKDYAAAVASATD